MGLPALRAPRALHPRRIRATSFGDMMLRYAVEKEPPRHAGAIGSPPRDQRAHHRLQRRRADGSRPRRHGPVPRRARAEATISLTRVDDPSASVSSRPRPTAASSLRREARARQGAEQLDRRGHLRARAAFLRADPAAAQRVGRARDLSAHARGAGSVCTDTRATRTGSTSGRPRSTRGARRRARRSPVESTRARCRERRRGVWIKATRRWSPTRAIEPPCSSVTEPGSKRARVCTRRCWARARSSNRGAEVDGGVLQTGARVSHGGSVRNSVVGAYAVLKPDVSLSAETIIGCGATVPSGTRISGGRVPAERE